MKTLLVHPREDRAPTNQRCQLLIQTDQRTSPVQLDKQVNQVPSTCDDVTNTVTF